MTVIAAKKKKAMIENRRKLESEEKEGKIIKGQSRCKRVRGRE